MPEIKHSRFSLLPARRRGIALLMVLLIVMTITIVSLGFIARSDVELGSGGNMLLRMQMDQLAQSGLEHAKGLAVRPPPYLQGCTSFSLVQQQLMVAQSGDFYDVNVVRDAADYRTYDIACEAYRRKGTERTGQSRLSAQLRLDPCIALSTGANLAHRPGWSCRGDLYSAGVVDNGGAIDGDVFAGGSYVGTGTKTGQLNPQPFSLVWPPVTAAYFNPDPNYWPPFPISPGLVSTATYQPAHIWLCSGDLTIGHNVRIEGMLLVTGNLTITGTGSRISAAKNLPALYVGGNLVFRSAGNIQISGLAVVDGNVFIGADSTNLTITGALFARQKIAETAIDSSGQGNDAILYSQPLWQPTAHPGAGGALLFDGVDDYLQTADNATRLQLADQYTLSLWVKPAPVQKSWAALLCKAEASGTPPANHWALQLDQSATTLMVYHGNTANWDTGISLAQMADGFWHHVAIVRQADGIMVSYFDNMPPKTLDPADPNQAVFQNRLPGNGNGHLNIGADRTASPDYVYKGLLDDICIYDRALGPADISKLYSMGAVGGFIGYWSLDEAGSGVVTTTDPAGAAIVIGIGPPEDNCWSPAAGGFFRSIRRSEASGV